MRKGIKIFLLISLIFILFTAGCTQQQQEKLVTPTPTLQEAGNQVIQEPTRFVRDSGESTENINRSVDLRSSELIEIKYIYVPYDINSDRILTKINALNDKYGNVVHISKYDITKGISQELKDMGYTGEKGIPSVIINGKLIEPFTDGNERDLKILETAIKDSISKRK